MKTKMPYEDALRLAEEVKDTLSIGCERIEIAGSLRRKKAEIGDIELVAIPVLLDGAMDLFGIPVGQISMLDMVVSNNYRVIKGDKKYKQLDLGTCMCDLFIQPDPATWGVNMMIRTGSADFSRWMVTDRRQGGAKPGYLHFQEGRIYDRIHAEPRSTPEEADVFRVLGIEWIEPEKRTDGFWGQTLKYAIKEGVNGQ